MKRYEYAAFLVHMPFGAPIERLNDWPSPAHRDIVIAKMNELGADGWECFERSWPRTVPADIQPNDPFPLHLWCKREIPEAPAIPEADPIKTLMTSRHPEMAETVDPNGCEYCGKTVAEAWEASMGLYCPSSPSGTHHFRCKHERTDEDGICRRCDLDCRSGIR
jgi:hypothetical protein